MRCAALALLVAILAIPAWCEPSPSTYGNLLINRTSEANGVKPVTFSHWLHRVEYTCRVCHVELEFEMELHATDIMEEDNQEGEYCGACHNGKTAFGHEEGNCELCHNGELDFSWNKMNKVDWMNPRNFGNGVDWSEAARSGYLTPQQTIFASTQPRELEFEKELELDVNIALIPNSDFSHEAHTFWLDCANCHPGFFAIKKDKTRDLKMSTIRGGDACGICHGKVAAPIKDCDLCHEGIGRKM